MLGKLLKHLPAPALILLVGLFLLWLMGRLDGAQTARLAELDRQDQAAVNLTLNAAKKHRATVKASEVAQAEIARLRARQAAAEASRRAAENRASQWRDSAEAVLSRIDTAEAAPVRSFIAALQDQIAAAGVLQAATRAEADSLGGEVARWQGQALDWKASSESWQKQAGRWEGEAKKGCGIPLVGCISRSVVFVVGAAAGALGVVAVN